MATATYDLNEIKRRMHGATQVLKQELGGLRTGRASASLLEPVQVEAYGTHMPLNQLATVSVPEPRLLSVQVWDRAMVHAVEKAIINSNLGLSPATEGQVLRLRIPGAQPGPPQGDGEGCPQICRGGACRRASRASRCARPVEET